MPTSIDLDELRALQTPLVVYVGAELARAAGLPTRRQLARLLLAELAGLAELPERGSDQRRRELTELIERGDLSDAFAELERDLTKARFGLVVDRALRDDNCEVPMLARVLASLGSRVQGVVTPNLDRLLERAFAGELVVHTRPAMNLIHREGWLLKTHGTLPDRATWVFTRDQHAQLLYRDPVCAEVLRGLFLAKPMLFLGATLDDPIFDDVVARARGLAEGAPPRHWALLHRAELTRVGRSKLDEAGIAAIGYDDDDELLEILASLAQDPSRVPSLPPRKSARGPSPGRIRILFVSASPNDLDNLAVDHEQRAVREALARARHRDRMDLVVRTAACFADLSRALLEADFDIVHVAGHGEPEGIVLDEGRRKLVSPAELAALLDEYAHPRGPLRCVLLNSCWSAGDERPASRVPVLIAMKGPIDDRAALAFAEGFYDAIGAGRDFAAAYREGGRRARNSTPHGPFEAVLFERDDE